MNVLELYCGIGGCAAAVAGQATVTAAIDVSTLALSVYRENFAHPTFVANLETPAATRLLQTPADLWWMSPPCQPFTRRGRARDAEDPRSRSLLALLASVARIRPAYLALENVPGFESSETHARLRQTLRQAGYRTEEQLLCPTRLGVPMRRQRFYLLAAREDAPLRDRDVAPRSPRPLSAHLEARADTNEALLVASDLCQDYEGALTIVDRGAPQAVCTCFTAAYGRSPVHSGPYLQRPDGRLRRFHPREILALLGYPPSFRLSPSLDHRRAWRLVGNSLSVDVVRWWLSAVPSFANGGMGEAGPCSGAQGGRPSQEVRHDSQHRIARPGPQ